jgi:hypothetical protein
MAPMMGERRIRAAQKPAERWSRWRSQQMNQSGDRLRGPELTKQRWKLPGLEWRAEERMGRRSPGQAGKEQKNAAGRSSRRRPKEQISLLLGSRNRSGGRERRQLGQTARGRRRAAGAGRPPGGRGRPPPAGICGRPGSSVPVVAAHAGGHDVEHLLGLVLAGHGKHVHATRHHLRTDGGTTLGGERLDVHGVVIAADDDLATAPGAAWDQLARGVAVPLRRPAGGGVGFHTPAA